MPTTELADVIGWAYVSVGNEFMADAQNKSGEESDKLWALAGEKYEAALKVKPDKHEALYNWSIVLTSLAKAKSGEEAARLLQLANEKLCAARALVPEIYPADDAMPETESTIVDSEE